MTVHKITTFSVTTDGTEPLRGIVEIDTIDAALQFELDEDIAHRLCSDLERFLTQVPARARDKAR